MSAAKLDMDSVSGSDRGLLSSCHFMAVGGGKYNFRQSTTVLAANVTDGNNFDFNLGGFHWDVSNFKINDKEASGHWKNNDPESPVSEESQNEESGSFHAQAGVAPTGLPIVITEIRIELGPPTNAGQLFGCSFVPENSDEYTFRDRDNNVLRGNIKSGDTFDFKFPDRDSKWEVTVDFTSQNPRWLAHGTWTIPDGTADEESGTFHAQAGAGGVPTEVASAATGY